jgi:hypothetical protein
VLHAAVSQRQNLVGAMITGNKDRLPVDFPPVPGHAPLALLLAVGVIGGAFAYLRAVGWTDGYGAQRQQAKLSAASAQPSLWTAECGPCHLAYPAYMLPTRSWQRMLREQKDHFGEDLSLPERKLAALEQHAVGDAAAPRWFALMLQASVAPGTSPQKITDTDFWRARHRRIEDKRFKTAPVSGKHDCAACHGDAASGIFSPRLIHIPESSSTS